MSVRSAYQPPASSTFLSKQISHQQFSLKTNQPPAITQQYFSLRTNQHLPSATSQTNMLIPSVSLLEKNTHTVPCQSAYEVLETGADTHAALSYNRATHTSRNDDHQINFII
jgi:hypothetical protein